MSSAPSEHDRSRSRPRKLTISDYVIGICLLLLVVLLWTSSNFVTQSMFTGGYQKPFMMAYLSTASFILYLLPSCLRRRDTECQLDSTSQVVPLLREAEVRLTRDETAKLAFYFYLLWFTANWTLNAALAYTSVASATVLSSMSGVFTLAIGRLFHVEAFTLLKMGAVLASFGGVALVSFSDSSMPVTGVNIRSPNLIAVLGDVLALCSAVCYASYLIFLKVQIKDESRVDMQLFFGYVGLYNFLFWPVALVLDWLGVESLELPGTRGAVVAILVNMFITLTSDYLYVIAMLKTTPLVATIGLSLTVPLAVVGDYLLGKPASLHVLVGAVCVTGAFIVVGMDDAERGGER